MKNVAIIDIDGVLADYRKGLLEWMLSYRFAHPLSEGLKDTIRYHLNREDTWIDHEAMNMSFVAWLEVLEQFRMSGGKIDLPLFEGARELIYTCRNYGMEVVLLTSRPVDIYHTIYRDTLLWLKKNQLPYNSLLWSKDKAEMIFRMRLSDKTLFTVDDQYSHVLPYSKLHIRSFWIDRSERTPLQITLNGFITRVENLKQITESVEKHFTGMELL